MLQYHSIPGIGAHATASFSQSYGKCPLPDKHPDELRAGNIESALQQLVSMSVVN